jgi:catechol 2,3-dioxygenase-like lactoylglutathione lyase family enzyme
MRFEAIHHVVLPVSSPGLAVDAYERLGLRVGPQTRLLDASLMHRTLSVGDAGNLFQVDLLSVDGANLPSTPLATRLAEALFDRSGLFAVALRVGDLSAVLKDLAGRGVVPSSQGELSEGGKVVGGVALLTVEERAGANLLLVHLAQPAKQRHAALSKAGLLSHDFPLKRLDHLAAVARNLEEQTRFWVDVLGVPLAGEVTTPTLVIRQVRIGDAVLELLGPASADSPVRQRPPGLVSLASWEVSDLDAAVSQARLAGFTVTDPAPGALPRSRTATIPAVELAGLTMQLLQYVG